MWQRGLWCTVVEWTVLHCKRSEKADTPTFFEMKELISQNVRVSAFSLLLQWSTVPSTVPEHCPLHSMCSSRAQCPSLAPSFQKTSECPLFTSFALEHRDLHSYPQLTSDAYQRHWSLHVEELSTPLLHEQQRRPLYSTAAQAVEKTTFLHPMCSSGEGQSTLPFLCCSTSSGVEAFTLLTVLEQSRGLYSTLLTVLERSRGFYSALLPVLERSRGLYSTLLTVLERSRGFYSTLLPVLEQSRGLYSALLPVLERRKGQ